MLAGAAAVVLLAFPAAALADVHSDVTGSELTVTSTAADAIEITCVAGKVKVNDADPDTGEADCADITSIVVHGGPGANFIDLSGVTDEAYTDIASVTVDGDAGNDTITGSEHADELHGGAGADRILGDDNPGGTRDDFRGEAGDDTLVWNPGDDDDLMEGGEGADTIEVNGGGGGEQFEIKPSATPGRVVFDRTGPVPVPGRFNLDIGTSERLDLNANGGDDTLVTANGAIATALDIDGGPGNDTLDGGDAPDLIAGGDGNDRIIGDNNPGDTRDRSLGGAGDDTMVWNPGDGDDVNEGGDGGDTVEVNGGGGGEQFEVKPSAIAGRVVFDRTGPVPVPGRFNLDIGTSERLDLNANGGDDALATATGAPIAIALDIDGGPGNDTLDGSDGADLIAGGDGNDRIIGDDNPLDARDRSLGGAGDDTMVWNPGDDDDVNEGGDGFDTVEVNGGAGGEEFEIAPSETTAGRVSFDRTGPTPPGPFNIDIGTSERIDLNANGGDDKLHTAGAAIATALDVDGGPGNDTLRGSAGEDVIAGGDGNDVIRSKDKAADDVDCGAGVDFARVDRRDSVAGCNIVLGGALKVRIVGKPVVRGGFAVLRLRCVATDRCRSAVRLLRRGRTLGTARATIDRGEVERVRVRLNRRGRRLVAGATGKGARVRVRIDSRDAAGNGWRSTAAIRLKP